MAVDGEWGCRWVGHYLGWVIVLRLRGQADAHDLQKADGSNLQKLNNYSKMQMYNNLP